jgi:RNA recognition motif-containing protein
MSNHEINGKWVELRKAETPGSTPKGPSAFRPDEEKPPHLRDQFAQFKLFVGGIDGSVSNEVLRQYFEFFGKVIDSVVMVERGSLRSRGFGFVTMGDSASFENALNAVKHELNGKAMEVKQASPTYQKY